VACNCKERIACTLSDSDPALAAPLAGVGRVADGGTRQTYEARPAQEARQRRPLQAVVGRPLARHHARWQARPDATPARCAPAPRAGAGGRGWARQRGHATGDPWSGPVAARHGRGKRDSRRASTAVKAPPPGPNPTAR